MRRHYTDDFASQTIERLPVKDKLGLECRRMPVAARLLLSAQFLLDYMPRANPVIAYNDFEAGDDGVYVVGPFREVPDAIALENRSATTGEVRT